MEECFTDTRQREISVETNEWFEPSFLQQLVAASATLTLTDGEKKSFPLKIGGG